MGEAQVEDTRLGDAERAFLADRDTVFMATVNEAGWPYVQHRGGPPGFLRVIDDRTLAFADFSGNRQLLSTGNLAHDDRVSLFVVDQANRRRLKLMARAEVLPASADPELTRALEDPSYRARIERVFVLHLEAFDWNCPQHITPRFTVEEVLALAGMPGSPFALLAPATPGGDDGA